jgi:hypothetical protein
VNDGIAGEVVLRHTCRCDAALEKPADDGHEQHLFLVDGEHFPYLISERGPIVTRLRDDLYTIDVEIIGLSKDVDAEGVHHILEITYATDGGNTVPYIPVIAGKPFPWPLTDDGCQLNFSHKMLPKLNLKFYARTVTGNYPIVDGRSVTASAAG